MPGESNALEATRASLLKKKLVPFNKLQTPAQLAKHLPSLRNARHLTQAQLGMLVGLDQTRIAKIEADPRRVSVGQLFKILSALGVQVLLLSNVADSAPKAPPAAADW
jgi:HTH-type transcriptional regulator / antitoxin HipB